MKKSVLKFFIYESEDGLSEFNDVDYVEIPDLKSMFFEGAKTKGRDVFVIIEKEQESRTFMDDPKKFTDVFLAEESKRRRVSLRKKEEERRFEVYQAFIYDFRGNKDSEPVILRTVLPDLGQVKNMMNPIQREQKETGEIKTI